MTGTLAGLVVGVCVAAGAVSNANGPFVDVKVNADSSRVGDNMTVVHNQSGNARVSVSARDGWTVLGPKEFVHRRGETNVIYLLSKEGEGQKEYRIVDDSACGPHRSETNAEHTVNAAIGPAEDPMRHLLAIYADPDVGVAVSTNGAFKALTNAVHVQTRKTLPCKAPDCPFAGGGVQTFEVEIEPHKPYEEHVTADGAVWVGGVQYMPEGVHTLTYYARWDAHNGCKQCHCEASATQTAIVCRASMEYKPFIGLDKTDAAADRRVAKEASCAIVGGDGSAQASGEWTTGPLCTFENWDHMTCGMTCEYGLLNKDDPSDGYEDQDLIAKLTATDGDGCEASAMITNKYTVVRVNVEIDGVGEETEETEGAYLYYIPDTNGIWTVEATNDLRGVKFEYWPKDLPDDFSLAITADKGLLYEKKVHEEDGRRWEEYKQAKSTYKLYELTNTVFVLHGHRRSTKYLGEEIEVVQVESEARDVAKFTIFGRPWLIPDYDRNGSIDEKDEAKAKDGKTIFRFWINDDNDTDKNKKGSIVPWDNHLHGSGENWMELSVQGRSDLLDYTPMCIDLTEVFPAGTPDGFEETVHWKLFSDQYKAVWTNYKRGEAGSFHMRESPSCGADFKTFPREAPVVALAGVEIPHCYVTNRYGVILVEGARAGDKFTIRGERGGARFSRSDLLTRVSPVKEMFRWINLRHHSGQADGGWPTNLEDPPNRPDSECDDRHFITVHGYNVNKIEARPWASEIFKRLWQSGSDSRFTAVDWLGDDGQIPLVQKTPNYYKNVLHAFDVAKELKEKCDELTGSRHVFLAHSLGNMLTSAAAQDYKMKCDQYYLLNAATPRQSYIDSKDPEPAMVDGKWKEIPESYWAAYWYTLYEADGDRSWHDFRKDLNWPGRFKDVPGVVNCYAPTEDVASDKAPLAVWKLQELYKGYSSKFFGSYGEAGWGFRPGAPENGRALENYSLSEAKWNPIFGKFNDKEEDQRLRSREPYVVKNISENEIPDHEIYLQRAKRLAYGIPATSGPCGSGAIGKNGNINYLGCINSEVKWPREKQLWSHSDLIEVAYIHMKKFYDKVVKGENQ